MFFIFEVSRPFQWRPFMNRTNLGLRVGWLYFAIALYHLSWDEFVSMAIRGEIEWRR